ncbi:MAG: class II aldolase/adducin family protein [Clostridia bacterium]|nr:class II aldolase/adducin family protein [Clostridia bacterium]
MSVKATYEEECKARKELVRWGKEIYDQGLVKGSGGNLSIKIDDNTVLLTPTGWFLGHMTEECISKVDMDGNHLDGEKPTKEVPLHLAVYKQRPNVKAVCHTHSIYAVSYSSTAEENTLMPVYTPGCAAKCGPIMLTAFAMPGSDQLGENVRKGIEASNATLMASHGVVAVGKDLETAVGVANEVENNAMIHFITDKKARVMTDDILEGIYAKIKY